MAFVVVLDSLQYMIILFLLFLLQFSLACALLAVNPEQKDSLAKKGWSMASGTLSSQVQRHFNCCGLINVNSLNHTSGEGPDYSHPPCGVTPSTVSATPCSVTVGSVGVAWNLMTYYLPKM